MASGNLSNSIVTVWLEDLLFTSSFAFSGSAAVGPTLDSDENQEELQVEARDQTHYLRFGNVKLKRSNIKQKKVEPLSSTL